MACPDLIIKVKRANFFLFPKMWLEKLQQQWKSQLISWSFLDNSVYNEQTDRPAD